MPQTPYKIGQYTFAGGMRTIDRNDVQRPRDGGKYYENILLTKAGPMKRRPGTRQVGVAPETQKFAYGVVEFSGLTNDYEEDVDRSMFYRCILFGDQIARVMELIKLYNPTLGRYVAAQTIQFDFELETKIPYYVAAQMDYCLVGHRIICTHQSHEPFCIEWKNKANKASDFTIRNLISDGLIKNIPKRNFLNTEKTGAQIGTGELTITEDVSTHWLLTADANHNPFTNDNLWQGATDADWAGQWIRCIPNGYLRIVRKVDNKNLQVYVDVKSYSTTKIKEADFVLETGWRPVMGGALSYPRTCAAYAGRLWFGGTYETPGLILGSACRYDVSKVNAYDFNEGFCDKTDAICEILEDPLTEQIVSLKESNEQLQVFCNKSVHVIDGNPQPLAVTVKKIIPDEGIAIGTQPISASSGGSSIFINDQTNAIQTIVYNDDTKSYKVHNLSLGSMDLIRMSEHCNSIVIWKQQADKSYLLCFINNTESLVTILYDGSGEIEICGFSKFTFMHTSTDGQHIPQPIVNIFTVQDTLFFITDKGFIYMFDEDFQLDFANIDIVDFGNVPCKYLNGFNLVRVIVKDWDNPSGKQPEVILDHLFRPVLIGDNWVVQLGTHDYDEMFVEVGSDFYCEFESFPLDMEIQHVGNLGFSAEKMIKQLDLTLGEVNGLTDLWINEKPAINKETLNVVLKMIEETGVLTFRDFSGASHRPTLRFTQKLPGTFEIKQWEASLVANT